MKEINVLSLFDGMSCGQLAINRLGINYNNYFASEIDNHAIKVTQSNFPKTKQLGSVVDLETSKLPKIDLLIGGSPCQSFSFAGKRKGMTTKTNIEILSLDQYLKMKEERFEFHGQSYLFWEYMRILKEVKPKYFILENVVMSKNWESILSNAVGCHPILINSSLLSAQNRKRLYWTNIGKEPSGLFGDLKNIIPQPIDKNILLKDVLEMNVDKKYFLSEKAIISFYRKNEKNKKNNINFKFEPTTGNKKSKIITTRSGQRSEDNFIIHNTQPRSGDPTKGGTGHLTRNDGKTYCLDTGNTNAVEIKNDDNKLSSSIDYLSEKLENSSIRKLTPIECERLQTVPDNYTNHVSDTQRYKMLGNGWTIDVICHILRYAKF
jgi:DNA (cytosine-5)-methyltransferase 3A